MFLWKLKVIGWWETVRVGGGSKVERVWEWETDILKLKERYWECQ